MIKTAPLIWRSILVNEDTCMLHLPLQEPLPLRSRYIEQRPCATNFLSAEKQRHWRIRCASAGALSEAILSSFREVSAVRASCLSVEGRLRTHLPTRRYFEGGRQAGCELLRNPTSDNPTHNKPKGGASDMGPAMIEVCCPGSSVVSSEDEGSTGVRGSENVGTQSLGLG